VKVAHTPADICSAFLGVYDVADVALSCVVDTLSVVVYPTQPAQIPLSLPLFDFAPRTERSAATCVRRRRPGHAGNLREGFR
jgi:hypothetical protein